MMFWDISAMIVSAFLFAGLAMPIKIFYKKTPKWFIPLMAGLGMMSYQVFSEYQWFDNTASKLPEGSVVVATVPKSTWFRPWSYIKPQVFQFVVLDTSKLVAIDEHTRQAQVYFFERRLPAQRLDALFDCQKGVQTYVINGDFTRLNWQKLDYTDKALGLICKNS